MFSSTGESESERERDDSITHDPLPLSGDALHTEEGGRVRGRGAGFGGCLFAGWAGVSQYET